MSLIPLSLIILGLITTMSMSMLSCSLEPGVNDLGLCSTIHPSDLERSDEMDRNMVDSQYQHVYMRDGLVVTDAYEYPSEVLASSHTFRQSDSAAEYIAQKQAMVDETADDAAPASSEETDAPVNTASTDNNARLNKKGPGRDK